MKIVNFSIRRPVTVTMFWVACIIFGLISFQKLAINLLPDITYPTLTIRTEYPGTAPAEVENLISIPIEETVGVVTNVVKVSSVSRAGISDVIVEFNWGTNMDFASMDVREKLDVLSLPEDAEQPVILRFDPSQDPIMRLGLFGDEDLITIRRIAEDEIKQNLESLEGVAAIKVSGGLEEEIQVSLNETKLASLNIPITQVTARLAQENINLTAGTLKEGDAEYLVRTLNEFKDVNEINDIVISDRQGVPILLSDIGRAYTGYKDRNIITRIDDRESVEIAVYKEASANTVRVASLVKERIESIREELQDRPESLDIMLVTNQSEFIEQSINEVLKTALIGGILAIIILYFFLRNIGSTIIISLAIPISVIVTFFLMYSFDVSLNIMSLGGLALGIGMLVDNSIVVLESIDRYRKQGYSTSESASIGAGIVGKAVVAATLTTVCVFLPIIFVKGVSGQLFIDQALTVTFSLLTSLVVALTLIPMLSSIQFSQPIDNSEKPMGRKQLGTPGRVSAATMFLPIFIFRVIRFLVKKISLLLHYLLFPVFYIFEKIFNTVIDIYPSMLSWVLLNRAAFIIFAIIVLLCAGFGSGFLGLELIPEMSQGEFYVNVKLPVGTPIEVTDRTVRQMARLIQEEQLVKTVYLIAGSSGEEGSSAQEERENIGMITVKLHEGSNRIEEEMVMNSIRNKFRLIPQIETPKFQRPSYFSYKAPIEVEIRGYNLQSLTLIAEKISEQMHFISGITDIKTSMEGGNPEVQVIFNREKVAALGTNVSTIASVIRNKVEGDVSTEFSRRDRKIDIRVRARIEDRQSLDDLRNLTITSRGGIQIPLIAVADLNIERGPSEIRRIDQERVAIVSANLSGRDLGSVANEIESSISNLSLPQDFSVKVSGQNEEMATSFTVPFSLIGVIGILLFTRQTVSVVVLIGLIMLAGIVVNNAIVLVDYVNHLRRTGTSKKKAIIEAGKVRIRPILMTTSTTVLGLLPMALGFGEGNEVRAPMAITVIGGLLMATFLNLLLLPAIYSIFDRKKRLVNR